MSRKKKKASERFKTKTLRFHPQTIKGINRVRKENKQGFAECVRVILDSYLVAMIPETLNEATEPKQAVVN